MKITKDSIGTVSLDKFVEIVAGIYHKQDEKRSVWDIWLHATHHAASIGEEVRKEKPEDKLLQEIADFCMWLFTFVGKINHNIGIPLGKPERPEESAIRIKYGFSDLIWNKYPYMCPVCFGRRVSKGIDTSGDDFNSSCDCLLYEVESREEPQKKEHINKLRSYAKTHYENKPISVGEWQKMFSAIYQANLRHLSLADIAFHLLEEVGEVSDAMVRMYTYSKEEFESGEPSWRQRYLENEIADVTSWMFTLVNKLEWVETIAKGHERYISLGEEILRPTPYTLSGIIWKRYGSPSGQDLYCPHKCKQPICKCPIYLVRTHKRLAKLKNYAVDILT